MAQNNQYVQERSHNSLHPSLMRVAYVGEYANLPSWKAEFNFQYPLMEKTVKRKLWHGMVELPEFEIKKFLKDHPGESLKAYVGDKYMVLTPDALRFEGVVNRTQESKINKGQLYNLIGLDWNPQN